MYDKYLSIADIPVGDILKRILHKENMSQRQLAIKACETPQRINDIIAGRRRITPEQSIKLEKALGIEILGFFYKIQANHDIYEVQLRASLHNRPDLSHFRNALFWDIDVNKLDWQRNKKWIIQRVFEYGNEKEMKSIILFYGKATVEAILSKIETDWNAERRMEHVIK